MVKFKQIFSSLIFYLSILTFVIGFQFSDTMLGGWTQQFMPNLNNMPISDIFFLDSLTGWAVTNNSMPNDSGYILKTTNSGDNWVIKLKDRADFTRIKFVNQNTGFASGGSGSGFPYIYKSTNAGENWNRLPVTTGNIFWKDMAVLNKDTIWVVDDNSFNGGIYITTNGGSSWQIQQSFPSANPNKIYMYNKNIGFACDNFRLYKTTNGENWTQISGTGQGNSFIDMYFADSLTGWKTAGDTMKYTLNGGLSWSNQILPSGGIIASNIMTRFKNINKDTLWGCGGYIHYPNNQYRGILYRTIDKGLNWSFQLPDTNINIAVYEFIDFINNKNGWGYINYPTSITGIHTTTGGDTEWYIGIQQISNAVPEKFTLKQNYPNPFNPRTVIPYSLSSPAYVKIIAYDIQGREVQKMVDQYQQAGVYEVDFMGKFTSTGVYFYRMTVTDNKSRIVYTDTKKMVLIK